MIESKKAVENIDAILAVEGVDGVFIGPYDMSGSYGITGKTSHRSFRKPADRWRKPAEGMANQRECIL
jgi:2-keto-3-deoxy-L-rhamnonate aldolase RhmA